MFRDKNTQEVISEGYSGRAISSQLGERWRSLSTGEKQHFGFQAFTVRELKRAPQQLERTKSVYKSSIYGFDTVDIVNTPRRKSF